MRIAFTIIGLLGVLGTLIPFSKSDLWWVRMFDFPCTQLAVLLVLSLLGFLFFRMEIGFFEKVLAVAALLALIYQITIIYPYTPFAKAQVFESRSTDEDNTLTLLSSNVLMYNRDSASLLEVIREANPDLVILLEPDHWWQQQMQVLKDDYPYFVEQAQENTYGMLLYSKRKLIDPSINFLVEGDIPSIHTMVELPSGQLVQLYCIHPTPPSPTENDHSTERDAELLIVGKKVVGDSLPTIVAGDLNDVAWSSSTRLFLKISELLDPRIGRGFYNTFHAKIFLMRWPLDHVFHSDHFKLMDLKRLSKVGSDHFPILIKLIYEPLATLQQQEPKASAEEKVEAEEQIEKAMEEQN